MTDQYFKDTGYGKLLLARAGLSAPLRLATFGDSHCANYFIPVHNMALARYDANINFDVRQVYVEGAGANDAQTTLTTGTLANRGAVYATGGTSPAHMINTQLVQFASDVAGGRRYDIGLSDGALYNSGPPSTQANLDTVAAQLQQVIDAFLDPAGNNGMCFIVWGTHGIDPTLAQSWALMWQRKADLSAGRIFYVDTAKYLIDSKAYASGSPAASVWTIRGGTAGTFGSVQTDGAHVGGYGAWLVSEPLAAVYQTICAKRFPIGGAYTNKPYDPVNFKNGDLLGPDAAMVGTAGIDLTAGGGTFDATIPGTGHSGAGGLNNRWGVAYAGMTKPTFAVTTDPLGGNQLSLGLSGNCTAGFSYIEVGVTPVIANVNNSDATRKYNLEFEVEYVGVTGAQLPNLRLGGVSLTPPMQNNCDAFPNNFSATLRMRNLDAVALSGNNPGVGIWLPIRQVNGLAGTINVRYRGCRLAT